MSRRICGPGLCSCDKADTCPECAERKVEASCEGLCELCYLAREEDAMADRLDDRKAALEQAP